MASAFIIENTAGTLSISLAPGQLDGPGSSQRTTDAHLYGLGALSWGEGMDINILRLLESFACPDKGELGSPVSILGIPQDENDLGSVRRGINNPIPGQQWFNTTNNKMYVYYREEVGSPPTVQEGWKLNSNVVVSTDQPSNPKPGDLWLDTTQTDNCNSHMLKVYRSIGGSPETYDFVAITENSVSKCGDAMTGHLTLNADPTNPLHAATKQYVDVIGASATAHFANMNLHLTPNQNTFLDLMSGVVGFPSNLPVYLDDVANYYHSNSGTLYTQINNKLPLDGSETMTGSLNMGNHKITTVADPTAAYDAVNKTYVDTHAALVNPSSPKPGDVRVVGGVLQYWDGSAWVSLALSAYPIGSYYISENPTSPALLFGGTWTQIEGRAIVGAGSWTDERNESRTFLAGATGGEYQHVLTIAEMPAHKHFPDGVYNRRGGRQAVDWTSPGNNGTEVFESLQGGNIPHNNMMPYIVAYIWRRDA